MSIGSPIFSEIVLLTRINEMKSFKYVLVIFIILLFNFPILSQNPKWINYINGNYIETIEVEGNFIWVGTRGGLVQIDKSNGSPAFYDAGSSMWDVRIPSI